MVELKLYVEGGGDSNDLKRELRKSMQMFLDKTGLQRKPRVVACGSRQHAYDDFKNSIERGHNALLLVDSEDPVSHQSPWGHLRNRRGDEFLQPTGVTDDHCHLMVVCMESWFLADREALNSYFGQGFNPNALPKNPDIESVAKEDVYAGLKKATAQCKSKGRYNKGAHSFKILQKISPEKVISASPWAKRLLDELKRFSAPDGRR